MWAGSRIRFDRPLRVGDRATRQSEIAHIVFKEGRSGKLGFVTVKHTYSGSEGPAIAEEQDIVYREPPAGGPNAEIPRRRRRNRPAKPKSSGRSRRTP